MTKSDAEDGKMLTCPFCGDVPLLDHASLTGRVRYFWVACRNQKCTVLPSGMQCVTAKDAIAAWNRRASSPAPEGVERVRTYVLTCDRLGPLGGGPDPIGWLIEDHEILAAHPAPEVVERLREFARETMRAVWGGGIDGGDVQEIAIKHGLIVSTSYNPERHGDMEDTEPGDEIFVFSAALSPQEKK